MKNLFIDVGSNIGKSFIFFKEKYPINEFDYFLFEPNPNCFPFISEKIEPYKNNVFLFKKAVSNKNIKVEFKIINDPINVGSSIIPEHNFGMPNPISKIEVECVDFDQIIEENKNKYLDIVVKFDCESSEYDILDKIIFTGNIKRIKKIYCEFHSRFFDEPKKSELVNKEKNIIKFLKENNIDFQRWR